MTVLTCFRVEGCSCQDKCSKLIIWTSNLKTRFKKFSFTVSSKILKKKAQTAKKIFTETLLYTGNKTHLLIISNKSINLLTLNCKVILIM